MLKNLSAKSWKVPRSFWRRKKQKQQDGREWYKKLSEDKEHRLIEYRTKCYIIQKNKNLSQIKTYWYFTNIKNGKAVFKTHLKWSTLTFSRKYEKLAFQTSIWNFLFGKEFFLVIIRSWLFFQLSIRNIFFR